MDLREAARAFISGLNQQIPAKRQIWIHIKTGMRYRISGLQRNATNAQDGRIMVAYRSVRNSETLHCREVTEFMEKFKHDAVE